MPSARVTAAHARDAAQRHRDYASPVKMGNVERTGIYPAPKFERIMMEGGIYDRHDCYLTLIKVDWPELTSPEVILKKTFELKLNGKWIKFTPIEPQDLHVSSEWKMGLIPLK